jgi:chromosome segregation ATPase
MFDGGNIALQVFLLINVFVIGIVVAIAVMHARAHFAKPTPVAKQPKREQPLLPLDTRQRIINEAEEDYQKVLHKSALELERNLETTTSRLNDQLDKLGANIVDDEMERYRTSLDNLRKETQHAVGSASEEIEKHQLELRTKLMDRQAEIESKLAEQQSELEAKLAARTAELDAAFKQRQAEYSKKQADIEATLEQHQAELASTLKEREAKLAQRQAELDAELLERQKQHAEKQAALEAKLEQDMEARRVQATKELETSIGDTIATFLTETLGHNVDLGAQVPYLTAMLEEHKDELVKGIGNGA